MTCFDAAGAQAQFVRRGHQGGGLQAGEHITPGRASGIDVALGQPGHEAAIRPGGGQAIAAIARKQFVQQDRQRPAIEHDVVIGQHQPVSVVGYADESRSESSLVSQIADSGALARTYQLDLLIDTNIAIAVELDIRPGRDGIDGDELHRFVELVAEVGHQVGMASDHAVHRSAQPTGVKGTAERDLYLHRIDSGVTALRGGRMK
ncbi:hypothetical protein MFM001_45890 [Mycobacterium sp. MFM001]|nr:hypothetical protein MFM001_45890 [Mycobacterium sp. MFM001]